MENPHLPTKNQKLNPPNQSKRLPDYRLPFKPTCHGYPQQERATMCVQICTISLKKDVPPFSSKGKSTGATGIIMFCPLDAWYNTPPKQRGKKSGEKWPANSNGYCTRAGNAETQLEFWQSGIYRIRRMVSIGSIPEKPTEPLTNTCDSLGSFRKA